MHRPPRIFEPAYYERLFAIEDRHGWSRGLRSAGRALVAPRLARDRPLRALDAGCGAGRMLLELRRFAAAEPVGLDLSPAALGHSRRRGATRLMAARLPAVPVVDARFDLIVCIDTLQHLAPRGADRDAVAAFSRLLVPGGVLYLRTNAARGRRRLVGVDPDRYRRYRPEELRRLAEGAGLEVLRVTHLNCVPSIAATLREWLAPRPAPCPASGPPLEIEVPRGVRALLGELTYAVLAVEALWLRLPGARLPFGHSLALVARRPV